VGSSCFSAASFTTAANGSPCRCTVEVPSVPRPPLSGVRGISSGGGAARQIVASQPVRYQHRVRMVCLRCTYRVRILYSSCTYRVRMVYVATHLRTSCDPEATLNSNPRRLVIRCGLETRPGMALGATQPHEREDRRTTALLDWPAVEPRGRASGRRHRHRARGGQN